MRSVSGVEQVAANLYKKYGTKADVAREMLDMGYSVSQISKAVPMAYSQVHSYLAKKGQTQQPSGVLRPLSAKVAPTEDNNARRKALARSIVAKTPKLPVRSPLVGKLRTGNLTGDRDIGPCANCGHDLVVRKAPTGLMIVHVNITSDEYINTVQFCQAVPNKVFGL
jgi:predicted transcriptional regulator